MVWAETAFTGGSGLLDAGAGNDTLVLDFGHVTALGYAAVSSMGTGVGGNFGVTLSGTNGGFSDSLSFVGFEHITLLGSAGNDSLEGVDLAETLRGRDGDDWITGGRLGDLLDGGAGNDSLRGGDDDDILSGGAGVDRFIFEPNYGFLFSVSANHDTITDYTAGEVISFANFVTTDLSDLTITQSGANKLISWSDGSVTLLNYSGLVTFEFGVDPPYL